MSEHTEPLSQAIYARYVHDCCPPDTMLAWNELAEWERDEYRAMARAAEAYFEPTLRIARRIDSTYLLDNREAFLAERSALLTKKFQDDPLSSDEENRLRYIRIQLDRIQDIEIGPALDDMEALVKSNEALTGLITDLLQEIKDDRGEQTQHQKTKIDEAVVLLDMDFEPDDSVWCKVHRVELDDDE